jgi:hypothetical protein
MKPFSPALLLAVLVLVAFICPAAADEGMWLFNKPPRAYLEKHYHFDPTDKWLDHVQKSSVRFNVGGSASFVSPDGLVMTNHHVGSDAIQKLSTDEHNYLRDGFFAKTRKDELKCTDQELNVLISIEDVTEQVNAAVKPEMSTEEAFKARRAVIAEIEKKSFEQTKLRSDVVSLYSGAQYSLYRYKKYTDVRLVFAPEQQAAFFGGDPDNFEYPRYDLDISFFRVYEDDKPAKTENYLKWSKEGAKDGELIFVSGNPGRTDRNDTVAELEYLRDHGYPFALERLYRWEVLLSVFSGRSAENARRAKEDLFDIQNSRKARVGGLTMPMGLMDSRLMDKKKAAEKVLRDKVAEDPKLKEAKDAWNRIAEAEKVRAANARKYTVLEGGAGFHCTLFGIARHLLRAGEERAKPNTERLPDYRDTNLDSLKQELFSEEPIYDNLEEAQLTDGLTFLAEQLGYQHELVQKVLLGKSPQVRAAELIQGTKLKDVAVRKKLYEGGKEAVEKSHDPLMVVARIVDPESRALRKIMETQVDEVKKQAHLQIEKVRYAIEGASNYPDATFTLRLSFGVVKGYKEHGKEVPAFTDFAGLYERAKDHDYKEPFDLPKRWVERKDKLNLKTPFNFVCTADIIGGNSGSPVMNEKAELVGIIFDGNIQSLVLEFGFTEEQARAVAVDARGIIAALDKVYDAKSLVDELLGRK